MISSYQWWLISLFEVSIHVSPEWAAGSRTASAHWSVLVILSHCEFERPHQHKYQVVRRARKWLEFLQPYPINLEDEVITMFKGLWALLLKLVVCPESKRQKLKDKIKTLLKVFSISNNLRFGRDPSFWISIFFLLTCRFI